MEWNGVKAESLGDSWGGGVQVAGCMWGPGACAAVLVFGRGSITPLGAFLEEDCGIGITCWRLQFLDTEKKE